MSDPIARAYAQLGIPPGTSPARLRKQYRALVRKWHPDRFASDPQGQAEAADRMREINAAYQLILEGGASPSSSAVDPSSPHTHVSQGPLTRDEIERMIEAVGTDGPVDTVLDALHSVGSGVWTVLAAVAVVVASVRLVVALYHRDWVAIRGEPRMVIYPVLAGVLLAWYWQQSRQADE